MCDTEEEKRSSAYAKEGSQPAPATQFQGLLLSNDLGL